MANNNKLTIRLALPDDDTPMLQLTRVGMRPWSRGYALVAERDGVAVAAMALHSGSVVFNPGHPTDEALRLLRVRRHRLMPERAAA